MSDTIETVKSFLTEDKLRFFEQDNRMYLTMYDASGTFNVRLFEANDCFLCVAIFPVRTPDAHRPAMAELINRFNWNLLVGNWEMDWSNGEVHYRTSVPARNAPLTVGQARDVCYINFQTFSRAWRMLLDVIAGTHSPLEAIDAEKQRDAKAREEFANVLDKTGFKPPEDKPSEDAGKME